MANENLSPDIYGVNNYVNKVKKEFITGVNEDTLMLGIFGYTGQIFSDMFQNSIIMASEFSNESIATKAKFEKNIIAHALGLGITDINAIPAQMEVFLTFVEDDIVNWANARTAAGVDLPWEFTFDKDNQIFFGDYEFHTDFDIVLRKVEVTTQGPDKRFAYTAQYKQDDFDRGNPVAKDINNPYLPPPIKMNYKGMDVILVKTTIRQVEKYIKSTKVLSDNDVSSKTITFTFEGNLAAFSLDVTEGSETYHMVPVYEGLNIDTGGELYFWYTFLDSDTIRIKFDRNSRIPAVNADVQINLQTTQGSKGNFTFYGENYPEFSFESEKYSYSNIMCQIRPIDGNAMYGTDKKTIEELKQIIPREALSRGSITNLTDLENFFNATNNDYSKLYFYKLRDNCLQRLYSSFMIMRNDLNIVPTNTINMVVSPNDLQTEADSGKLILKQGRTIILKPGEEEARLLREGESLPEEDGTLYDGSFAYYLPYDLIINRSPIYGMYFMTTMHATKHLDFQYINENCIYQYIATKMYLDRNCLEDHNTYIMTLECEQNITPQSGDLPDSPIYVDEEGNTVCNVNAYIIFYDEDNIPLRYAKAEIVDIELESGVIKFQFKFTTEDYIDNENRIRIDTGLYDINSENESYAHFKSNMTTRIFITSQQGESYGLGDPDLSKYIPNLTDGWSLSNTYNIIGGLDFFYDYSNIVNSIVTVTEDPIEEAVIEEPPVIEDDPNDQDTSTIHGEDCTCDACIVESIDNIEEQLEWKTSLPGTEENPDSEETEDPIDPPEEGGDDTTGGGEITPEPENPPVTPEEPEDIIFEDLGVILSYMSDAELQLYDTERNKIGPVINLPMNKVVTGYEQDIEKGTIKLFLDEAMETYIVVKVNELTYDEPDPIPTELHYHITGIPVVKQGYFKDEETAKKFYEELLSRKIYIDKCIDYLEDAFEMDFKFFNTYGPSKYFTWDNALELVDRVNATLFFRLKLKPNYNSNIVEDIRKDIKDYIEDINNIKSIHIPNLITLITNTYKDSIEYFEFVSINGKETAYQHIYHMGVPDGIIVPEFININTLPDERPDIHIDLV